ncbi:PGAP1-domain-containing protein [Artomyces pyxidatus]|uniref:PGAP1-domain-containing protein n=1 Tax=Artomyces pyxidatus TaxID=48021 RepID=A0ACB8TE01_9AGAM|nr:PGAP1-domain-containing protein [Artomyces pyxidatus]
MSRISYALGAVSLFLVAIVYKAASETTSSLSPQGCRMSYMSPSYLLQPHFNSSWTHLAKRYSLSLYREVGWESNEPRGVPVLFIPGNAGSSHQIRSIASSAARQFYSSPYTVSPEFSSRSLKPLDFYAVEYNEDLSAFHGPTIEAETTYAASAISYILSLYPANTTIIVMGHSMGGIVATSLLPSPNISAIITMSTPHALPPARFDRRIAALYDRNHAALMYDSTPMLSLCGGAGDLMIPSEACILPQPETPVYRRTVFSSALEGCWTSVGHQVMVWCHQVRWRVARAALEMGAVESMGELGAILDRWLRDGQTVPHVSSLEGLDVNATLHEILPAERILALHKPTEARTYLLPVPTGATNFVLYLAGGSILSMKPRSAIPLLADVRICTASSPSPSETPQCNSLAPRTLELIPDIAPGRPFPVPHEGVDESQGIVHFEAVVPVMSRESDGARWVAVSVSGADGRGWVMGGFVDNQVTEKAYSIHDMLYKDVSIPIDKPSLQTEVRLPQLLSNALAVYRVTAVYSSQSCSDVRLPPLLRHTSPSEAHFHPLTHDRPVLLHAHTAAPFIPHPAFSDRGVNLTIFSSGECELQALRIRLDWWGMLGRAGARYWAAAPGWAVGVVIWSIFLSWGIQDVGGPVPNVSESLSIFTRAVLPSMLAVAFFASFLPLPVDYLLGNSGEAFFSPIAPTLLLMVTGLVHVSWWLLCVLMWPLSRVGRMTGRQRDDSGIRKNTLFSMFLIFILVFLIIPWQVAFLGCWAIHFFTCATHTPPPPLAPSSTTPPTSVSPTSRYPPRSRSPPPPSAAQTAQTHLNAHHHNTHLLLLMTWLLPLVAPVLAVWVRTLATAGLTTPFDGDHSFWTVAPYLVLVDFASWTRSSFLQREDHEFVSIRWFWIPPALVAFFWGAYWTYEVFDWVWIVACLMVVIRVGPKYWGGAYWSSASTRSR